MKAKIESILWCLVLLSLGGIAGYHLHSTNAGCLVMPVNTMPQLEYLTGPESFSRVQNTKELLTGFSLQLRIQAQTCLVATMKLPSGPAQEPGLRAVLCDLESGMKEFAGTEQELDFLQEILFALKSLRQFDQWTDVYLKALYEHPTHPAIIRFAAEAIPIGKAAGREKEVLAALAHVASIPVAFNGKDKIAAILTDTGDSGLVAQPNPSTCALDLGS